MVSNKDFHREYESAKRRAARSDAFEPRALFLRCARGGEKVPLIPTRSAHWKFVAGKTNFTPMLLPTPFPLDGRWVFSLRPVCSCPLLHSSLALELAE